MKKTGNRRGARGDRKSNSSTAQAGSARPRGQSNGPLFSSSSSTQNSKLKTNNSPEGCYPNGDRDCLATAGRITLASCVIQNYRNPDKCGDCKFQEGIK